MDDYILKYYYSTDDLNNGDMFCVGEEEIERASKQDEERLLTNISSGIFNGYNRFKSKRWGDDESNR